MNIGVLEDIAGAILLVGGMIFLVTYLTKKKK
jgi:hypothetical protein